MRKRINNKAHSYHFDSMREMGEYIANTPRTWDINHSRTNSETRSWDLSLGYDGAVKLALEGWPEGARQAQEALKALPLKSAAPDTRTDFYGFMPHVPRFCAGAPDSMVRHVREGVSGAGRVLTLYIQVNATGDVSASAMRNFGLGVAQYVNQLETDGTRVEVYGAFNSLVSGVLLTNTWLIKRADQMLDLAVLAFAVGHPACFRRLGFAVRERSEIRRSYGYGHTKPLKLENIIDPPAGSYVLNGMYKADDIASTPQAALDYIGKQIDKMIEQADAD